LLASTALALAVAVCATATRDASTAGARPLETTTFESWAVGNGTGSFFRPVGPAGGTGVRHAWP
jgi:hypothetical protein